MTETTDKLLPCQQMLPCLHCKQTSGLFTHEERGANYAGCHECNIQTDCFVTLEAAIAAWNRRTNDVNNELYATWKWGFEQGRSIAREQPKWTRETPKETCWYMARFYDGLPSEPVRIVPSRLGGFSVRTLDGDCRTMDTFCKRYPDAQWLKIDIPALPEEADY